jgi:hypothetical protein
MILNVFTKIGLVVQNTTPPARSSHNSIASIQWGYSDTVDHLRFRHIEGEVNHAALDKLLYGIEHLLPR